MSTAVSGKSNLNVVLCGTDAHMKTTVSKILRGKPKKSLDQKEFNSVCVKKEEKVHGRQVCVVELPALTGLSDDEMMHEIFHCLSLCYPGVHVFIFIPVGQTNNKAELEKIQKIFGSRDHFMMLFTTELPAEGPVTGFIKSWSESLNNLCGGRYKVLSLKEQGRSKQIPDLLDYIENMKTEPYSLQMFMEARENQIKHETNKKYEEKLKRMENEIKELKDKMKSEGERIFFVIYFEILFNNAIPSNAVRHSSVINP